MLTMHCAQCGSEIAAAAARCQRCGRAVAAQNGWGVPKPVMGMADTVDQFRDELKNQPPAQPTSADTSSRPPLTLNAQWSTLPAEAPAKSDLTSGAYPFLSAKASPSTTEAPDLPAPSLTANWGTAPLSSPAPAVQSAIEPVSELPVFMEGQQRISLDALPPDHWSRQVQPRDPEPVVIPPQYAVPAPLQPPPPQAEDEIDIRDLAESVQEPRRTSVPLLVQVAAVLVTIGIGIGISSVFFGKAGAASAAAAVKPQLKDVEVTGFRMKRLDGRSASVRFLAINHGAAQGGNARIEVILRSPNDHAYTFQAKVPAVGPGQISEITVRVDAPPLTDETVEWQKLKSEYQIIQ